MVTKRFYYTFRYQLQMPEHLESEQPLWRFWLKRGGHANIITCRRVCNQHFQILMADFRTMQPSVVAVSIRIQKALVHIYLLWWFFYYNFNCTVCLSISLSEINSLQGRRQHCRCGCNIQWLEYVGNAAALLIWLLRPDSTESCDDTWVMFINNLLLSALTSREGFATQSYAPSGELLSDRLAVLLKLSSNPLN